MIAVLTRVSILRARERDRGGGGARRAGTEFDVDLAA
jgi:hypothetical protein